MSERLTATIVLEYQGKIPDKNKISIGEFKAIGRELKARFDLTDREALDLLRNENVLKIMSKHEEDSK